MKPLRSVGTGVDLVIRGFANANENTVEHKDADGSSSWAEGLRIKSGYDGFE